MQKDAIIIIWDDVPERINEVESTLKHVLKELGMKAEIQINCEAPLLSRNKLIGKTPALQINNGDFWTHTAGKAMSKEELSSLFRALIKQKIL